MEAIHCSAEEQGSAKHAIVTAGSVVGEAMIMVSFYNFKLFLFVFNTSEKAYLHSYAVTRFYNIKHRHLWLPKAYVSSSDFLTNLQIFEFLHVKVNSTF